MGIYLNPGYGAFEIAFNSNIYVDKTEMIQFTNSVVSTSQRYIAVSRPRRFGKSYAVTMLCAYYGAKESREIFEKCKVSRHEGWDAELGKYDVIRLVMTDFVKKDLAIAAVLKKISSRILDELEEEYPGVKYDPDDLFFSMEKFYRKSGKQFVVVIDEWDAIFRENPGDDAGQKLYLDFLRDWLKDKEYIALAYMTGILPVKKYGKHSALNMFSEYSMIGPMQLASFTGFTEDEVKELCRQYGRNFEAMKEWYDGYIVSDIVPSDPDHALQKKLGTELKPETYFIYSPLSVVTAVSTGIIENYWNKTETYEALAEYINKDFDGLKEIVAILMDGGRFKVNVKKYQNDMTTFNSRDDVLTLLIHLGYLGYDSSTCEVFIPNKEILDEFKNSTEDDAAWLDAFKAFKLSMELLNAIWNENAEKTAELMELAHDRAGNKTYNSEAALSYGIQYALYAAQKYYTEVQELDTCKGYADLVYIPSPRYPDKPALLMELKYNKDVKTAADQVRDRNYPQVLEHYAGNILVVSVNYDKDAKGEEFKKHSCRIERA